VNRGNLPPSALSAQALGSKSKRMGRGPGEARTPNLLMSLLPQLQSGNLVRLEHRVPGVAAGATVKPNGSLFLTTLPSVMTPASVIWAMLPLVVWVNQTVPSGDAAMPSGPTLVSGNSDARTPAPLSCAWARG
jgi:hypothetical protein